MANDTTVYTTYPEASTDERGRYFDGQFLTAQDFVDEQRYHVDRLRRALDHLTVSGVADGLDVAPAGAWKIRLAPGLAIDGVGRQLLVLAARDPVDVPKDIPGGVVDVALYYAEIESRVQGGTSDEAGTRGASRLRELPALEFYAAGQAPKFPDGVPLARLRLAGDGAVTLDAPNPVRRATGLRLPSSGQNPPTLRAGFARANLLALTGDLQVTGRLGIGTPDPEAELDVRGVARLGHLSQRSQSFRVDGDEATFYPIVFRDHDWALGQCVLELLRTNAQADAANAGVLLARLRWHAADGQGAELLDVDVVQTRRFLAHARPLKTDKLLVVWLRGARSYAWRARQRVELVDGAAATKTVAGEKLDPRADIDPGFDRDRFRLGPARERETLAGNLLVQGDLAYTGKLDHLDVAEATAATVRSHDLYLGHSTRRGSPGRALVDNKGALVLNFGADWPQATVNSKLQVTGDLAVDKGGSFGDQVRITDDAEHLQLFRPTNAAGGNKLFLELFQQDGATPETYPAIRFHHAGRFYHRLEARGDGLHVKHGDLASDGYKALVAADITANGLVKAERLRVTRDTEHAALARPNTAATGGTRTFLELVQEDVSPVKVPETFPAIRFHHQNRWSHRLEAQGDGLHVRDGNPDGTGYRGLSAGNLTANGSLTVTGASSFADHVRIADESEHLKLARVNTQTKGGNRLFLELIQEDQNPPKIPEVATAIRFHHNCRYWHRIEGNSDGIHVRDGDINTATWHNFYAADIQANGLHVVAGKGERLRMIRGTVNADGGIVRGSGFTVVKDGSLWKLIFSAAFDDAPTVVATQQYPDGDDTSKSGNTRDNAVIVRTDRWAAWVKTGNGDGDQSWRRFHFIAVGN